MSRFVITKVGQRTDITVEAERYELKDGFFNFYLKGTGPEEKLVSSVSASGVIQVLKQEES